MLASRWFVAVVVVAFTVIATSDSTSAAGSPDVEQLLKQLRSTLIKVQGEIAQQKLPELKSVEINLQTGIKATAGRKDHVFCDLYRRYGHTRESSNF